MRIGACTTFAKAAAIKDTADFIEEGVNHLLVGEGDAAKFAEASAGAADCGMPIPVVNGFIPAHLKSVGPLRDMDALCRYANVVMTRARCLGIQTIVFGSGGSRKIEAGMEPNTAMDEFKEVVAAMAPIAAENGVTMVIEPLNSGECNFINSLAEGAEIVTAVNHANVKLLADFYHMRRDAEGPEEILRFGPLIRHVHVAECEKRTPPGVAGDDFRPWLQALKDCDYQGDISIEASWGERFLDLLPQAVAELRKQAQDVGFTLSKRG